MKPIWKETRVDRVKFLMKRLLERLLLVLMAVESLHVERDGKAGFHHVMEKPLNG